MNTAMLIIAILVTQPKPIITIDDGPDHRYHTRTLQLLQRHRVKAIWFVNGHFLQDKRNRALLRKIHKLSHTVANHTWSHRYPCKLTARQFKLELIWNERAINRTLRQPRRNRTGHYRPPFGERCHAGLARRLGYIVLYWHRADLGTTAAQMIKTVRRRHARQHRRQWRGRTILLFHYHNHKLRRVLQRFFPIPTKIPPRP